MRHQVVEDTTSFGPDSPKYERIVCMAPKCLEDCVVRQGWITDPEWEKLKETFRHKHPTEEPA